MPSFLNQIKQLLRPASSTMNLCNNYTYVEEENISKSLICPICLDPLIDPYTHTSCDNSFCNKCIKKLRTCPFCRSTILNSTNLKMTNRALRNILDELAVQCNVCKQILQRGDFSYHCKENCLPRSFITHHQEEEIAAMSEICKTTLGDRESGLTRDEYDQHLSNVYRRIHKLETELFELKKAIYFCIFVIACLLTIIFFGSMLTFLIYSFFTISLTVWIPTVFKFISTILFDFSPSITLLKIFFTILFLIICHQRHPSDISLLTIIICSSIVLFNGLIFIGYIIINHSFVTMTIILTIALSKYYAIQIPSTQQINRFINDLRQSQR